VQRVAQDEAHSGDEAGERPGGEGSAAEPEDEDLVAAAAVEFELKQPEASSMRAAVPSPKLPPRTLRKMTALTGISLSICALKLRSPPYRPTGIPGWLCSMSVPTPGR
jgi:hypothetical protein